MPYNGLRLCVVPYKHTLTFKIITKMNKETQNNELSTDKALNIADVIASASFKNDLEKAIEMGENVGFNEDGGYYYFSQSDAFEAVVAVLKKHLL